MQQNIVDSLEPITQLSPNLRRDLMSHARYQLLAPDERIEAEAEQNWLIYLVEGSLQLNGTGRANSVAARSDRANRPLFDDPEARGYATTTDTCRLLRVDRSRFDRLRKSQSLGPVVVHEADFVPGEEKLMRKLMEDCTHRRIRIPSIPESVARFRAMAETSSNTSELAALIEQDPPIAGRLVSAANTAAVRGRSKINTVWGALVRLGLDHAHSLVVGFALKDTFKFRSPTTRAKHRSIWNHSVQVSTFSRILAKRFGEPVDCEKAFMVGLLENIGALALLAYIDRMDIELCAATIDHSVTRLTPFLTQLVQEEWDLDSDFAEAAAWNGRWAASDNNYVYLAMLATHQALIIDQPHRNLPTVSDLIRPHCPLPPDCDKRGIMTLLCGNPEIEAMRLLLMA